MDLLTFQMTLNENHDAEFIAQVMKERDRVSEEARKAFERAKGVLGFFLSHGPSLCQVIKS